MDMKSFIRDVPDFPKKGIVFKDLAPLLRNPEAFEWVIAGLASASGAADVIVALDARGFVYGAALAAKLKAPLVLVRKKGKLPGKAVGVSYGLEYGEDVLEIQEESLAGARVLVVDDVLATGGTAQAACKLVEMVGGSVVGCAFVVELSELGGRSKLDGYPVNAVVAY